MLLFPWLLKYRCVMRPDKLFSKKQNWSFKDIITLYILSLTLLLFNRNIYGIHVKKNYISYSVYIINFQNITYKKLKLNSWYSFVAWWVRSFHFVLVIYENWYKKIINKHSNYIINFKGKINVIKQWYLTKNSFHCKYYKIYEKLKRI